MGTELVAALDRRMPTTREPHVARALAALGLLGVTVALAARRLDDFDLPWHILGGRIAWETKGWPRVDAIAYTHAPLAHVEIAGDLAFYGGFRVLGPFGLQLFGALLAAAMAAAIWARLRRHGPIALVVTAGIVAATSSWLIVRASSCSFALLAIELWLLDLHAQGPDTRRGRRALAAIVPMHAVWANTHGYVALGVLVALLYAGYRIACRFARGRLGGLLPEADAAGAPRAALFALLAIVATTLNDAGPRILLGPRRLHEELDGISEWAKPTLHFFVHDEPVVSVLALLCVAAIVFGREPDGGRLPRAFDVTLALLGLVVLGMSHRMVPLTALLSGPIIARRAARFVRPTAAMHVIAAFATLLVSAWLLVSAPGTLGVGFDPTHFPEGAVQWVERAQPRGRMWNFWPYGGYLALRLYPSHLVFMDGRNALARDPSLVRRDAVAMRDRAAFDDLAREYEMTWAVTRAGEAETIGSPLANDPRWTMTFLDDVAAVYVERNGSNAELGRDGYRVLRHTTPPETFLARAVAANRAADLAHDGALAAAQAPASARAAFFDACGAIAVRDDAAIAAKLARFRGLSPGSSAAGALASAIKQTRGYDPKSP